MEKNTKRKNIILNIFKVILLIIILIIAYFILQNTYSKYLNEQDNSNKYSVLGWNIKLNDKDLTTEKTLDFSRDVTITYEETDDIAEDKVAPTSKGTFDLTIDSTGTELPYKYVLTFAEDEDFEEKVDTKSSYDLTITKNWTDSWNKKTQIFFNLSIDYSSHDEPIAGNNGFINGPVEVQFTIPEGNVERIDIYNLDYNENYNHGYYNLDGYTLTFTPAWYMWRNGTTLTNLGVNIYYGEIIVFDEVQTPLENVSLGGKEIRETNYLPDFRITSYTINDGPEIEVSDGSTSIEGVIIPDLDSEGNITNKNAINKFTITIEWYDGEDNIYDNAQDVSVAKRYNSKNTAVLPLSIPLNLEVTQLDSTDDATGYYNTIKELRDAVTNASRNTTNTNTTN